MLARVNGGRPPGNVLVKGIELVAGMDEGGTPEPPNERDFMASMLPASPGGRTGMVGNPACIGLAAAADPVPLTTADTPDTDVDRSEDILRGTSEKPVTPAGPGVVPGMDEVAAGMTVTPVGGDAHLLSLVGYLEGIR